MNAALARGDAQGTLALAAEYAKTYPDGTLAQENAGARALALCMRGDPKAAREFIESYPASPLVGRLRAVCGLTSDSVIGVRKTGQ
jgi:hypothetical protein